MASKTSGRRARRGSGASVGGHRLGAAPGDRHRRRDRAGARRGPAPCARALTSAARSASAWASVVRSKAGRRGGAPGRPSEAGDGQADGESQGGRLRRRTAVGTSAIVAAGRGRPVWATRSHRRWCRWYRWHGPTGPTLHASRPHGRRRGACGTMRGTQIHRKEVDMAAIRRAEATWSGALTTGSGHGHAPSRPAPSPTCPCRGPRGPRPRTARRAPRSWSRRPTRRASRWPCPGALGRAGTPPERLDVSAEVTFDKLEAGWRVVSSALTVRGRVPGIDGRRLRRRRRGDRRRLPDQPGAQGQRRAQRRGDARGLTADRARPSRSSGAAAGWRPSSSRSRRPRRRRRGAAAGTSRPGTCSRCPRSGVSCESWQTSWLSRIRSAWPRASSSQMQLDDAALAVALGRA